MNTMAESAPTKIALSIVRQARRLATEPGHHFDRPEVGRLLDQVILARERVPTWAGLYERVLRLTGAPDRR